MNWYVMMYDEKCRPREYAIPYISSVEMGRILAVGINQWLASLDDSRESQLRSACYTLWD